MSAGIDLSRAQADFLARVHMAGGTLGWHETHGVTDSTISSCRRRGWTEAKGAFIKLTPLGAAVLEGAVKRSGTS